MKNNRYERKFEENLKLSAKSKLIWHPSEVETYYDRPRNSCCLFRKTFEMKEDAVKATLYAFGDTHYILYVNGSEVGRGPCRSDPRWQYVDCYDILPYLNHGTNVISAAVMHYGYDTGKSINRIPCFLMDGEIQYKDKTSLLVYSDEETKAKIFDAFDREAPRINGCKGCVEMFDNRKAIDFTEPSYDDSDWDNAKGREKAMSPFWNLKPRPIPNIALEYVSSKAIIAGGVGTAVKNDKFHVKIREELEVLKANTLYALGSEGEIGPVDSDKFNYVLVDFGKVRAGYLNLEVEGYEGDIVDVVYAEEIRNNKPRFDIATYRPVGRFILKDGLNHLKAWFNYEAFRYVFLIFRNHVRKVSVKSIGMQSRSLPFADKGYFKTKDAELQNIWDICVHTLDLCMQDGFLDSPSREQQQWMGDARFQAMMNYYITGDARLHEKLLLQIGQSQDLDGMTCSRYPDGNHNLPPIPSFCLQWINAFKDYYLFTGKTELIEKMWQAIIRGIRWFSAFENEYNLLTDVPYWNYLDMSKNADGENPDIHRGGMLGQLNMMYIEAMQSVIFLAKLLGDKQTYKFFRKKEKNAAKNFKKLFWNAEFGAYSDCVKDGVVSSSLSESVNALAYLFLHETKEQRAKDIMTNIFDPATRREKICYVSPYFMFQYYRALKKADRCDIALSETKNRYHDMVEHGATTTWEHWVLYENTARGLFQHSACHAWASAPIIFVAENLFGVNATDAKGLTAAPHFDLTDGAEGYFVTPRGTVEITQNGKNKIVIKEA